MYTSPEHCTYVTVYCISIHDMNRPYTMWIHRILDCESTTGERSCKLYLCRP